VIFYILLSGALFGIGVFALLQRSLIRILIGLLLIGNAVNLGIFTAGGARRQQPPIVGDSTVPVDPVPQALLLTAIVIGFALAAFGVVLVGKVNEQLETEDTEEMRSE